MPRRRILLVNDDPDIAESLHMVLEQRVPDIAVVTTFSGAAALEMLREGEVDLLVCDPLVRTMDTRAFLRHAREVAPEVPHLILAGTSATAAARIARDVGADAVLAKPIDGPALERTVSALLHPDPGPEELAFKV